MQVLEQLKKTSAERFLAIYESLQQNGYGPLDGEVAKVLHFRPLAIKKLPMAQRARRAKSILESARNTELAYEILGAYLIKNHRELVTTFLDETGVKHDQGMIDDVEHNQPDAAKIEAVLTKLDGKFDPADVTVYLAICAEQWPQIQLLDQLWQKRAG
ncbi:MAG: hypothetical protein IPJ77_14960 [Planctomycetes bacterium]|nr:hypothetical protein [Planctomycetota bacterium]